jgi:hypothetical protein
MNLNTETGVVQGKPPSTKSLELQKAAINLSINSIESLDNAARNLVPLVVSLLTVYLGVFTFFKINEKLNYPYISYYLMATILVWLISVVFSILATMPFKGKMDINCVTEIEDTLYKISTRKWRYLFIGYLFLIFFIILSVGLLWLGLST